MKTKKVKNPKNEPELTPETPPYASTSALGSQKQNDEEALDKTIPDQKEVKQIVPVPIPDGNNSSYVKTLRKQK